MNTPWKIIIASTEPERIDALSDILKRMELEAVCSSTVIDCVDLLAQQAQALVFCDRELVDGTYLDVMTAARLITSRARFVVTSREVDWDHYMEANRAGAFHVMSAPYRPQEIEWIIVQAKRNDRQTIKRPVKADSPERARQASGRA